LGPAPAEINRPYKMFLRPGPRRLFARPRQPRWAQ
jgi:hypothetical protein